MTAINIPDMVTIAKKHGLVPVPLDINPETMAALSVDQLKSLITDKVYFYFKRSLDQGSCIRLLIWNPI